MLKSACQAGGCGACSAVLTGGRVEMGDHDPDVIRDTGGRWRNPVVPQLPREDCRIDLPYDRGQIVTAPPTRHQARITGLDRVADAVMRLRLTLLDDAGGSSSADFESGQFVRIWVPGRDARRAYSPANVANWDGELEFYIRLLPGGAMSEYLSGAAALGDELTVTAATGEFGLAESGLRPRWFIAGGTGLSPLLSMLRRMADWGDPQPARLFFGVTRHTEVFGQEELRALADSLPDFRYDTVVWHPDPAWAGATGNPVDLAAAEVSPARRDAGRVRVRAATDGGRGVCGAGAAGVPEDQIHAERFSAVE